jgi:endonuclease G
MRRLSILVLLGIWGCSSVPPKVTSDVVLDHGAFKIYYDQDSRLPKFVIYQVTKKNLLLRKASRKNRFMRDPILVERSVPSVSPTEYKKSGYDKGHLAPSADFSWSQEAQNATFVMSNMVPQKPKLNRDAWKRLEEKVRRWACGEERITVITGPIIEEDFERLPSGLPVPQKFFKVVIDETPPKKTIAFIYHQEDQGDVMRKRQASFTEVEKKIRFASVIPELTDDLKRAPAALETWKESDCR